MRSGKGEGCRRVVDGRLRPGGGVVTLRAVLPIETLVGVVFLVAGITGRGGPFKNAIYMTRSASCGDMFPRQRKCGSGVIDGCQGRGCSPVFGMTSRCARESAAGWQRRSVRAIGIL